VAAGGAAYVALAHVINRTQVVISGGTITISHGPLPWAGWRQIPAVQLDQLYCREIIRRTKNGPTTRYELWAALAGGKATRLMTAGMEPEPALYLEQQIERAFEIPDRPVAGEVMR
jgi:hypothetical protein